jgi:nitroreductase
MPAITEVIKKRFSCRTYADKPIEEETLQKLKEIMNSLPAGPFGGKPRFALVSPASSSPQDWKKLGTYGVIKNARLYVAGAIKDTTNAMEDYGYCKELLVLQATQLGLGTCWLGGTFSSGSFARAINLQEGESLPTVTPVGYPAVKKNLAEKMMRSAAGSDKRKPWSEIFFADNFSTPLTPAQAGIYAEALENVRLAPSAGNRQPWRILYDTKLNVFHFFIARTFSYKLMGMSSLQDIDLGIAMSHFELTTRERGISGQWQISRPAPEIRSLDYIVSWQGPVKAAEK